MERDGITGLETLDAMREAAHAAHTKTSGEIDRAEDIISKLRGVPISGEAGKKIEASDAKVAAARKRLAAQKSRVDELETCGDAARLFHQEQSHTRRDMS